MIRNKDKLCYAMLCYVKTPTLSTINRSVLILLLNVERHGFRYCEKCNYVSINTIENVF